MSMSERPIANDNQLQNQRTALAQIEEIMHGYERELAQSANAEMQESIRAKLYRVYMLRFNIRNAIHVYVQQHRQSA